MNPNVFTSAVTESASITASVSGVTSAVSGSAKSLSTVGKIAIGAGAIGAVALAGFGIYKLVKSRKGKKEPAATLTGHVKAEIVRNPDIAPASIQMTETRIDEAVAAGDMDERKAMDRTMDHVRKVVESPEHGTIQRVLNDPQAFQKAEYELDVALGTFQTMCFRIHSGNKACFADGIELRTVMDTVYATTNLPVWAIEVIFRRSLDMLGAESKEILDKQVLKGWKPNEAVTRKLDDSGVIANVLDAKSALDMIRGAWGGAYIIITGRDGD